MPQIISALHTAPSLYAPAAIGNAETPNETEDVHSTFAYNKADQGLDISVEQIPANHNLRRMGVQYTLLLDVRSANFDFLSYEYRIGVEQMRKHKLIQLHAELRSTAPVNHHLAFGYSTSNQFRWQVMRPVNAGLTYSHYSVTQSTNTIPFDELTSDRVSACILFDRKVAMTSFAFYVELV